MALNIIPSIMLPILNLMNNSNYIPIKYGIFALISIGANLLTQEASMKINSSNGCALLFSILMGTIIGLLVKYSLDKKYIFNFYPTSTFDNLKTFFIYAVTGIGTTFIFWTTEIGFQLVYESKVMRYIGAVIGLTIGYTLKYLLDRNFVFSAPKSQDQ